MTKSIVTLETAQQIAGLISQATKNQKGDRSNIVKSVMEKHFPNVEYQFVGEVPAKGKNGMCIEMQNAYRINYRCGYSRHNYAPCIEISK